MSSKRSGSELFIVDNADDDWKVHRYLHDWCDIAHAFDIATGFFEIGSLLSLDGQWQKLEKLRILMGDEVSKRTKKAFESALSQITTKLDDSIEAAKEDDDFLGGVPAIVEALRAGQIQARVYRKKKVEPDSAYAAIGEVSGSTFTFTDKTVKAKADKDLYAYTVTSLNSEGKESPIIGSARSNSTLRDKATQILVKKSKRRGN